jgi:hypothetical protein
VLEDRDRGFVIAKLGEAHRFEQRELEIVRHRASLVAGASERGVDVAGVEQREHGGIHAGSSPRRRRCHI